MTSGRIKYRGRWHATPNDLVLSDAISKEAKAVFHNFAAHANLSTGDCYPSRDRQVRETGFGKASVSAGRRELLEKGYLHRERIADAKGKFVRYQWTLSGDPDAAPPPRAAAARTEGVLHDGTPVVRRFGEWQDAADPKVNLSRRHYPELGAGLMMGRDEWERSIRPLPSDERPEAYRKRIETANDDGDG